MRAALHVCVKHEHRLPAMQDMRYVDAKLNSLLVLTDRCMLGIDDKVAELTRNITALEQPGAEHVRDYLLACLRAARCCTWSQLRLHHVRKDNHQIIVTLRHLT
jgi:hypothetical protein